MKRIRMQQGGLPRDATLIFSWIVKAHRQLTVAELQHALAVEVDAEELNEANVPTAEHMVQACAPLVTIDEKGSVTRLIHYTVQEFFEQLEPAWLPDAQAEITRTCITYLSFKAFDSGYCLSEMELQRRLETYKLYDYAARNWGHHAREASPLCQQEVIDFLQCEAKVEASSQALMAARGYSWRSLRQITGLHLASYFGVQEAVEALRGIHSVNSKDSLGGTPLMWAVEGGHEVVVKSLIDGGADVNAKRQRSSSRYDADDNLEETALTLAVGKGHREVIQLLLDGGANVNLKLRRHGSNQESVCGLRYRCEDEWTAMTLAVEKGYATVVRLLLNGGADVNAERSNITEHYDRDGIRKTGSSSFIGSRETYLYGLSDSRVTDRYSLSGFRRTRNYWNGSRKTDHYGWIDCSYRSCLKETALTIAVAKGRKKVIKLLLDGGADVNAKQRHSHTYRYNNFICEKEEKTALMLAVENRHEDVVELLLADSRIDPDIKDEQGRTPLSWAANNVRRACPSVKDVSSVKVARAPLYM